MIEAKKNNIFEEIDEIKSVEVFESDNKAVFKSGGENLKNYRIYGQTVDGESVGDRTGNLFDETIYNKNVANVTPIYVPIYVGNVNYVTCSTTCPKTIIGGSDDRYARYIFILSGNVNTGAQNDSNGVSDGEPRTIQPSNGYVTICYRKNEGNNVRPWEYETMLNVGSSALLYEPYGYKVPVTVSNGTDTLTTPIYLPEQIKKVGDEAEYIDYGEQKQHRVRKNLLPNTATSQTINGVTFTVNSDGSVTCNTDENGATASTRFYLVGSSGTDFKKLNINANAIITACPLGGNVNTYSLFILRKNDDMGPRYKTWADTGNGFNLPYNETNKYVIYINISKGTICNNLTFYPMIRLDTIDDDTYEPYIENTDLDVMLPALPTVTGTNVLSVNTNIKPSKVWGRLDEPKDILYVKDNLGNILFSKYHEVEEEPPLTYTAKKAGFLTNYRIYGQTVYGESVGDRTGNLFDNYPNTITNKEIIYTNVNNQYVTIVGESSGTYSQTGYATYTLPQGTYFLKWYLDNEIYNSNVFMLIRDSNNIDIVNVNANGASFTLNNEQEIKIKIGVIQSGVNINTKIYVQINPGSTPLPYEPYGYKVPVTVEGKNLWSGVVEQGGVSIDGTYSDRTKRVRFKNVPIEPGSYTISANLTIRLVYAYNGNDRIGRCVNTLEDRPSWTFTVPAGANNISIGLMKYVDGVEVDITPSDFIWGQIEKGSEATTYEPYHAPVTTPIYLPEQIRKVGDYSDYIDYGSQKFVHRVVRKVFDGTENIQYFGPFGAYQHNHFYFDTDVSVHLLADQNTIAPISNKYISYASLNVNSIGNKCIRYRVQNSELRVYDVSRIYFTDDSVSNAEDFKTMLTDWYINGDPLIVDYIIVEPVEEQVTLPALPTVTGTNVLSVGTEVQPSEVYIKGKIKEIN